LVFDGVQRVNECGSRKAVIPWGPKKIVEGFQGLVAVWSTRQGQADRGASDGDTRFRHGDG
jgi:hypothetical protein